MHDGTKNNILTIAEALHASPIAYNKLLPFTIGEASVCENRLRQWAKNEVNLDGLDVHVWFIMDTIFMYCAEVSKNTYRLHELEITDRFNAHTWPEANQLFNSSSVVICSAIDLLGHLLSIVKRETPDYKNGIRCNREWCKDAYGFYTHKSIQSSSPITAYTNNRRLAVDQSTKFVVFRSSIESVQYSKCIVDTVQLLRHKPIHNHYNYVVARHPLDSIAHDSKLSKTHFKWSLFDPAYTIKEVMEQRALVEGSNFNPLESVYFFPKSKPFIIKATDILDSLICYSIETFKSIVNHVT